MADAEAVDQLESKASPEDQARAIKDGWIPPARYRGEPEKFIDADQFLERGEQILPIVRSRLAQRDKELGETKAQVAELNANLKALRESFDTMEEVNRQETKRKVEDVKKQLKSALTQANKDGDHEAVAEITERMTTFNADVKKAEEEEAKAAAEKKEAETRAKGAPQPTEAFKAFAAENPWYGQDRRKTLLFGGIAQDLALQIKETGKTVSEVEFYDLALEELEKTVGGGSSAGNPDKTNGARGGARRSGGKSYNDLSPEAKEACAYYAKTLVGKGRRYEKLGDWQAAYAKKHFEDA